MKKCIESLSSLRSPLIRIFFIVLLGAMAIFATSMSAYAHTTTRAVPRGTTDEFSCYTTLDNFYQMPANDAPLHVSFGYAMPSGQLTQDMITVQQTGSNDFVWTRQSTGETFQSTITDPLMGVAHFGVTILQYQQVQAASNGDDIIPVTNSIWAAGICSTWYADGEKIGGYP